MRLTAEKRAMAEQAEINRRNRLMRATRAADFWRRNPEQPRKAVAACFGVSETTLRNYRAAQVGVLP